MGRKLRTHSGVSSKQRRRKETWLSLLEAAEQLRGMEVKSQSTPGKAFGGWWQCIKDLCQLRSNRHPLPEHFSENCGHEGNL